MFTDHHNASFVDNRLPRPDRRRSATEAEIRMRIRRLTRRGA